MLTPLPPSYSSVLCRPPLAPFHLLHPEVLVGAFGGDAAFGGAGEEGGVEQERLHHVLQRLRLLLERGRDGLHADGAAEVLVHHHLQVAPVERREADLVDAFQPQRGVRDFRRDPATRRAPAA